MSGTLMQTRLLETAGAGKWTDVADHVFPRARDYGSSVMYGDGKVIVMGGGQPPTSTAEIIDLNDQKPKWVNVAPMNHPRRQLNATLLPDGTVFFSGGTSGARFNVATDKVLDTELWDPANPDKW